MVEGRCLREAIARPVASRTPAATMKAGIVPDGIGKTGTPQGTAEPRRRRSVRSGPHIGSPAASMALILRGSALPTRSRLVRARCKAVEEPGRIVVANRPASANNRACAASKDRACKAQDAFTAEDGTRCRLARREDDDAPVEIEVTDFARLRRPSSSSEPGARNTAERSGCASSASACAAKCRIW